MEKTKIAVHFKVNQKLGMRFYLLLFVFGCLVLAIIILPVFHHNNARNQIMRNLMPQALIISSDKNVDPLLVSETKHISKQASEILIHYLSTGKVVPMKQHEIAIYIHLKRINSDEDVLFGILLNDDGTLLGIDVTAFDVRKPYKRRAIIQNNNAQCCTAVNDWVTHHLRSKKSTMNEKGE
ncbi:MAG: hypothetical protein WC109_09865 [Syntrophomonadaceae bacterium]